VNAQRSTLVDICSSAVICCTTVRKQTVWKGLQSCSTSEINRHRASTSTRWHFAFGLCCHSNETRAPIANLPNNAQLEGTLYHSSTLHRPCSSVGMRRGTDTHKLAATRVTNIHFASSTTHAKWNKCKAVAMYAGSGPCASLVVWSRRAEWLTESACTTVHL